jgi:hypothetical protein
MEKTVEGTYPIEDIHFSMVPSKALAAYRGRAKPHEHGHYSSLFDLRAGRFMETFIDRM